MERFLMSVFDSYVKNHDYLIFMDSDGCVMDTMNIKHYHCFGPCLVMEWDLEPWAEEILRRWNEINLYQLSRGVSRYRALYMMLAEVNVKYTPIVGLYGLKRWLDKSSVRTNDELLKAIDAETDEDSKVCLYKALVWSLAVNESINRLHAEQKKAFDGAELALIKAHGFADVAVITAANREAVEEEWGALGLLEHADIVLAQDAGKTEDCIRRMLEFGYDPQKVMLIGDDPVDSTSARNCGIWFYPILVNWEEESWEECRQEALDWLRRGEYGDHQLEKIQVFIENLGG